MGTPKINDATQYAKPGIPFKGINYSQNDILIHSKQSRK